MKFFLYKAKTYFLNIPNFDKNTFYYVVTHYFQYAFFNIFTSNNSKFC